jgi:CHASE3 domain sensor protein
MSSTIEQKLLRSFLVGVLFALVIGAAAIWLQREDLVSQNNAALAQAVISADHDLLRSHLDAETGERGFVITGDPAYLAPYTAGIAAVQNSLDRLRAALPDTPADRATLQSLVLLSATEGADMAQAIAARKSYGFAAAQAAVETGAGKAAMDRIRVIDAQIGLVYRARIDQEAQSAARRFAWAFSFLLRAVRHCLADLGLFTNQTRFGRAEKNVAKPGARGQPRRADPDAQPPVLFGLAAIRPGPGQPRAAPRRHPVHQSGRVQGGE